MKNIYFLSGLPRTGSTLLSAILSQNNDIHAEGNSAVCQLMWDMHVSCHTSSKEQLDANRRESTIQDLIQAIPAIYYKNSNKKYILDKCRSWTNPYNIELIKKYITATPKIIVLVRPIDEILKSFIHLYNTNNKDSSIVENIYLLPESEPIMRSVEGVRYAMDNNNGEFIFVKYENLINNTEEELIKIYDFLEIEQYKHNFNKIENLHKENDEVYGLVGQHDVREKISLDKKDIILSDKTMEICKHLNAYISL
jgi:sulfotransferase